MHVSCIIYAYISVYCQAVGEALHQLAWQCCVRLFVCVCCLSINIYIYIHTHMLYICRCMCVYTYYNTYKCIHNVLIMCKYLYIVKQ